MYNALLLALVASATAADINIDVGKGGLKFEPESVTAAVGDKLHFHFYSGSNNPHAVASAAYDSPCVPAPGAFFSGYLDGTADGSEIFTVDVTTTDPIWYYCPARRHCQNQMVGIINPPAISSANQTLAGFKAAAAGVAAASAPAAATGGTSTTSAPSSSGTSSSSTRAPTTTDTSATGAGAAPTTTSGNGAVPTNMGNLMGMVLGAAGLVGALV